MNTFAAWSHERVPSPSEAEKIADNLGRDIATLIRCATGPKRGASAMARGNMVPLAATACRQALASLLIDDHHFPADEAERVAHAALSATPEHR